MLTKIRKVKFQPELKNPVYEVILECPKESKLYIKFDYTYKNKTFIPSKVNYNREDKGKKLAWYTQKVEHMTVQEFLGIIAHKVNKKYNFKFKETI
ncbi:hypothetical protein [Rummeliibacillus suwonensis]|jgi:hypothetical protein|uniref:hypothetical protein n=1 Tax=Rummeliibacillus suwonensis TaxID=1306154 RepID=UPI0011B5194B|nr:hypothetical protein [Rummeliibacillus suwonensis]MBO2537743.1 hypothetical protein [Rummeliibacillus suwonensis]